MTIALFAAANAGCLILDPVEPIEDGGNTNPAFFQVQPENDATVFLSNSSSPVLFKGRATDGQTPRALLYYEWTVDNGPVVQEGPDAWEFTTNGAALGAGIHVIEVLVIDDGLPTGFATLEWQVQVQ